MSLVLIAVTCLGVPAQKVPQFEATSPGQVRAARASVQVVRPSYSLVSHDVEVRIDPANRSLICRDRFEIESLVDELDIIELIQTHLRVDAVLFEGEPLEFQAPHPDDISSSALLQVTLPWPLERGEVLELEFQAHREDFFLSLQQQLVAEIEVFGQVREHSSYSSHVVYYPIDRRNDAAVRLSLVVPEGYTAVTGGNFLGSESADGWTTSRFETTERRPRLLPFGFAVARFDVLRCETEGGLELELYHPPRFADRARQYLPLAKRAAGLFERRMGPLPWSRVALCLVEPERRETGVSLPGLILLSPGFFRDLEGLEIDGSSLSTPAMMSLLLLPDELSHQWNAYSSPLPNELAEGVSTFTNLLFIEEEGGAEEYRKGVKYCVDAYERSVPADQDVALVNPAIYRSPHYRVIAFCKVPAILHDLRARLGDEQFFTAWRRVFDTVRDPSTALADFQKAFEDSSNEDLSLYFDQWLFRPGWPYVEVTWEAIEREGQSACQLSVQQIQAGDPYPLELELDITDEQGAVHRRTVSLREKDFSAVLPLPAPAVAVALDPDGISLLRVVSSPP